LNNPKPNQFFVQRYAIPTKALAAANDGRVTVKFSGQSGSAVGGVYDVRLMKPTPRE